MGLRLNGLRRVSLGFNVFDLGFRGFVGFYCFFLPSLNLI